VPRRAARQIDGPEAFSDCILCSQEKDLWRENSGQAEDLEATKLWDIDSFSTNS